jgi:type IV pilus assembly protein PilB
MAKGILDILVSDGVIPLPSVSDIKKEARKKEITIEQELIARGIDEEIVLNAKSVTLNIPSFFLKEQKIPFDILKLIPEDSARHYKFVPVGVDGESILLGMVNPESIESKEALSFIASRLNRPFKVVLLSNRDFEKILEGYQGVSGEVNKVLGELETALAGEAQPIKKPLESQPLVEDAPITKMVAVMLRHATEGSASDIHIEPTRENLRVRFRVDGILYTSLILPTKVQESVVARIKILTNLQLDEKRKPQDGRFSARIDDREVDFRVSTFPTNFGEKVAIRILDPDRGVKKVEDLGLQERNKKIILANLDKPYGLVLVTGPTGSGKSTTLYSMLQRLNEEKWNVMSLEDPIEYSIDGLNQSQVRPEIGYDFAQGIRHILRQDPDIIMIGEIRDTETAKLAIHAALTGHLVFSTLHTNTAAAVVPRLIDMGIDPFLIPSTLNMAIGQRLVRTLCEDSKEEVPVEGALKEKLEKEISLMPEDVQKQIKLPQKIYRGVSSPSCLKGTKGRVALFEVFTMTPELSKVVIESSSEDLIVKEAHRQGMMTMHQDGILKVLDGSIGLEELLEVI